MRACVFMVVLCSFFFVTVNAYGEIAVNSRITIKPGNADEAAKKLIQQAELLNGYFITRSNKQVVLKIPTPVGNKMQQFIETNWLVYQQDYEARDITKEFLVTKSRLKAKEDLLDGYQAVLEGARSDKIIKVSSAVARLIQEIETLRGRVNYLEHLTRYAEFSVVFNIERKNVDGNNVISSFPWLNHIGLQNLLSDFAP